MKRPSDRLGRLSAGLVALFTASGHVAAAQTAEPGAARQVEIRIAPCSDPPYDPARFIALLRVELTALHVEATTSSSDASFAEPAREGSTSLSLHGCGRLARDVELRVLDSGTALERRVELSDIAFDARSRALAIAAAELFRAAAAKSEAARAAPAALPAAPPSSSAAVPPAPTAVKTGQASAPVRPPPPATDQNAEAPRSGNVTLEVAFVGRDYPSQRSALLGGALSARVRLTRALGVRGGVALAFGSATLPFDDANPVSENVALGAALGQLGLTLRTQGATFIELGPRADLGYGWVERRLGSPPIRSAGWISDLVLEAGVHAPITPHVLAFVKLGLGHTLGAVALEAAVGTPGATSAGLTGMLFEAGIGVGFSP